MIFFKYFVDCVSSFLQLLILLQFFNKSSELRVQNKYIRIIITLTYCLISAYLVNVIEISIIYTIITATLLFIITFVYKTKFITRIKNILVILMIIMLLEVLTVLLLSAMNHVTVEATINNIALYVQAVIISKILLFGIIRILNSRRQNQEIALTNSITFPFIFMIFASFYICYLLANYADLASTDSVMILVIVGCLFLMVLNLLIFYIFEILLRNEKKIMDDNNKLAQLNYEKKYYIDLLAEQRKSATEIHNLNNKLYAIKELVKADNKACLEELDKISNAVVSSQNIIYTGNKAIDALLNSKFKYIIDIGIELKKSIFTISSININVVYMCVILGNLLDNSIEACKMIEETNRKYIAVCISQKNNYLHITIKNTYNIKSSNVKTLQSTKKNPYKHGYGISTISNIVDKHEGVMDYSTDKDLFIIKIILNNQNY